MSLRDVTPTGIERLFGHDEIIVSKTDPRGVITYANDVFVRVSGYSEAELVGAPHSIVRHPDMPRCAFKLLWDTIASGREVFAYVLNLARDGDHYWVLAHVTPTRSADGALVGYHSNRRRPSRAAVAKVAPLYRDLLAVERRHASRVASVAAGSAALAETLRGLRVTYDEFVWPLTRDSLPAEAAP